MTKRTATGIATFVRPFALGAFGEQLPGGRYPTEIDAALGKRLSLLAYRRTATSRFKADPLPAPKQFEGALAEDAAPAPAFSVDPPKPES